MQITCGFSVKGCAASQRQEERNLISVPNIPPCVAHTSVNPLSTHIVGIAAGGESAANLALWRVMGTLLIQASLRQGLRVSWEASEWEIHLEIIVDYIKLSQGQTFSVKGCFLLRACYQEPWSARGLWCAISRWLPPCGFF